MNCHDARQLADPFLSDQLLVETTHDVVRHLETCAGCRREFDTGRSLRTRLQGALDAAPDLEPRPDFVAALRARLRPVATPPPVTRRAWLQSWVLATASLFTIVGGGLFARDSWRRSRLMAAATTAALDHQNCAIRFNLHERPIPLADAAKRYDRAYAGLASIVPPNGAPVLDRHSCVFDGHRFAHVVFRGDGHVVSLLVTQGDSAAGTVPVLLRSDSGFRVASFAVGTHAVFVVSDLSGADTLRIAQTLADPVRLALERS